MAAASGGARARSGSAARRRSSTSRRRSSRPCEAGLAALADPRLRGRRSDASPGVGAVLRRALAARPGGRAPARAGAPARARAPSALWLAQRLGAADAREVRLFALPCLLRALPDDPERAWQLHAPAGGTGGGLDQVDCLAELYARGRPRGALPLGRAGAARLLAARHGAAARRRDAGDDAARRAEASARARLAASRATARPGAHRPLIGDAEPAGPEGPLVGAPRVEPGRRRRRRSASCASRPTLARAPGRRPSSVGHPRRAAAPARRRCAVELRAAGWRASGAGPARRPPARAAGRSRASVRPRSTEPPTSPPARATATRGARA